MDRVADREELNDLLAQMVGELSALHIFVVGGDAREPGDHVDIATFGAALRRDEKAGGDDRRSASTFTTPIFTGPGASSSPVPIPSSTKAKSSRGIDGADVLGVSDERVLLRGK